MERVTSSSDSQNQAFEQGWWQKFASATNVDEFCQSWLAIQCRQIDGVIGGLVLMGPTGVGPFKPVAVWPDMRNDMRHLSKAAEQALVERRGLLLKQDSEESGAASNFHVAYPLELNEQLYGVIVLELNARPEAQLQAALRQLHWGSAWLENLNRRQASEQDAKTHKRLIAALDSMAGVVDQTRFYTSALSFVNELATAMKCSRVSIGFLKRGHMRVKAISHNAQFNDKANMVRAIGVAMDEAYDQSNIVVVPSIDEIPLVSLAHEKLLKEAEAISACSIPMINGGKVVGVLTLERTGGEPFSKEEVDTCESIVSLAGPALEEKRLNDRWLISKAGESGLKMLHKLIGPRHVAFKLTSMAVVALVAFFSFAQGDFRVSAKTIIEGQVQRVVTSPYAAYISESIVRAGDIVRQGQVMAILDDKDLKLEQTKLLGQKQQLAGQYRQAMAEHDRAQLRISLAKAEQADAQLELIKYKLSKTQLMAPFDGVVVTGDLSQALGAPVEKGQILFEVAPLDEYRIILQVNERDISHIKVGQAGKLVLTSLPDVELDFAVKTITPVSSAKDGSNFFRVEAQVAELTQQLRPGMEGVGKIKIGQENLFWIWTYKIVDWFRLWFWSWLP